MSNYTVSIYINDNFNAIACYSATTLGYAYKTAKEARFIWGPKVYVEVTHDCNRHYEAFEGSSNSLVWLGRTVGSIRFFRPEGGRGVESVYEGCDGYERF